MSEIADANIQRYTLSQWDLDERSDRFCLIAVAGYESNAMDVNRKRDSLLKTLAGPFRSTVQVLECPMGGCEVTVSEDSTKGARETTGVCLASQYCLKESFEAVPGDDGVEAGRARYRAIMDTCEGRAGEHSAGNFCPKLDCELSAGVSIDGIPGTSGGCAVEIRSSQGSLLNEMTDHNPSPAG